MKEPKILMIQRSDLLCGIYIHSSGTGRGSSSRDSVYPAVGGKSGAGDGCFFKNDLLELSAMILISSRRAAGILLPAAILRFAI